MAQESTTMLIVTQDGDKGEDDNGKNTGWKRRFCSLALIVIDAGNSGRGGARCRVGHLR